MSPIAEKEPILESNPYQSPFSVENRLQGQGKKRRFVRRTIQVAGLLSIVLMQAVVLTTATEINGSVAGIAAWTTLPYFVLLLLSHSKAAETTFVLAVLSITLLVCVGASVFCCYAVKTDAQGGLVFAFMPLYEMVVVAVAWIIVTLSAALQVNGKNPTKNGVPIAKSP